MLVLLAGCGGSHPPIGAPGAVLQSRTIETHTAGKTYSTGLHHHQVFRFSGTEQTFVVPQRVTHVRIKASGAGGAGYGANFSGNGGYLAATIPVMPGETLYVFVGGVDGFNGGGASDVRQGGDSLESRVVVAAGGGGAGGGSDRFGGSGGAGGGVTGGNGTAGDSIKHYGDGGGGGQGGSQNAGGGGGNGDSGKGCKAAPDGSVGALGSGGAGGNSTCDGTGAGGGGGGYYGGGGGGGGSSYVESDAAHVIDEAGDGASGMDGQIIISWNKHDL